LVESTDWKGLELGEDSIAASLLEGNVLRIPTDDEFDLSKYFLYMASEELLASHSFI
jgi:hypothetical protein